MYLGIDIGTSGVKAIVMNEDGSVTATTSAPLAISRPRTGWSEQAPDDWVAATDAAVQSLPAKLRSCVRGIGLAGQMHGATLLDTADQVLRPAILWNDSRSFAECARLEALVPELRRISGNIAMPGFTAPKLLWLAEHEPRIFEKVRTVLLPKDYVRLALTGEKASDMSDSSGTMWLDVGTRAWSDMLLSACSLSKEQMPRLFEGPEVTGMLRKEQADRWGMSIVPVVAGGGDNAAGAVGVGVVNDGDALLSLGTSGVIFVATGVLRSNPERAVHAFCHALPASWHQMSVHLSAASCVDWGVAAIGVDTPSEFFILAERAGLSAGDEMFLPYLSGERTPYNDPYVRGALLGLDHRSDRGRIAGAILEGVAFAHADGIAALREAGTSIEQLSVIGGGARSRYWGKLFAAALDVRLAYLDGGEVGPALGAAKLAMMGATGIGASDICHPLPIAQLIEPDRELVAGLAPRLSRFRAAYAALKTI